MEVGNVNGIYVYLHVLLLKSPTVLLVIFTGTNFCETGQNLGFRNFLGFNFRGR